MRTDESASPRQVSLVFLGVRFGVHRRRSETEADLYKAILNESPVQTACQSIVRADILFLWGSDDVFCSSTVTLPPRSYALVKYATLFVRARFLCPAIQIYGWGWFASSRFTYLRSSDLLYACR